MGQGQCPDAGTGPDPFDPNLLNPTLRPDAVVLQFTPTVTWGTLEKTDSTSTLAAASVDLQ